MIKYRIFDVEDIPNVLDMWKNTPGVKLHENGEDSQDGIRRCLNRNAGLSFVAEDNHSIIGAVLNGQDGRRGYIYHLVVDERYRKQGIASHLLELTEINMNSVGIHKLALFVLNENSTAQDVYHALEWKEVTEAKTFANNIKALDKTKLEFREGLND